MLLLLAACTLARAPKLGDSAWWPPCTDADGDLRCVEDGDCDDTTGTVYPDAEECYWDPDGIDNNCNGFVDECDCSDMSIRWGAPEVCDGVDDNCDGQIDEGLTATYSQDADGDGFGDPAVTVVSCDPGAGWSTVSGDCDDTDAAVHPGATEVSNGIDDDCDGMVDE